jgi:Xaa-Pro dipeptidase
LDLSSLYAQHLQSLDRYLADALERSAKAGTALEAVFFHAGREATYHADDEAIRFQPNAHFRRWAPPLKGPDHGVLARPGQKPKVFRVRPLDYWFDTSPPPASHYENVVDFAEVGSFEELAAALGPLHRTAFIGESKAAAEELGIPAALVEPPALLFPLDWHRATKTAYEVELLRVAAESGGRGHAAARDAFLAGASERECHWEFLRATGSLEGELSFSTIMAIDRKSAILHYQNKRGRDAGRGGNFLVDAGTQHHGYASDITRTWTREDTHSLFRALVAGVNALERELVAMVRPGLPYAEIHLAAHRLEAALLIELGILKASVEEALDKRLTRTFFPHGVGHQLGLQVHDVGGHQATPEGGRLAPPDEHVLRNTRTLEPGHYVTIEPGLYFIPMLLDPQRSGPYAHSFDWRLIDELVPLGGVRIEDDVLCTADGYEDLTRRHIEV